MGNKDNSVAYSCRHSNVPWTARIKNSYMEIVHSIPSDMQLSESKLHFNLISLGSCISSAEIKIIIASDLAAFLANLFQNITDDRQ